jgi:hypothetical protein
VREYALVFFVAAASTYLLTPITRRVAVRWGAMTQPRDRDVTPSRPRGWAASRSTAAWSSG